LQLFLFGVLNTVRRTRHSDSLTHAGAKWYWVD